MLPWFDASISFEDLKSVYKVIWKLRWIGYNPVGGQVVMLDGWEVHLCANFPSCRFEPVLKGYIIILVHVMLRLIGFNLLCCDWRLALKHRVTLGLAVKCGNLGNLQ